MGVRVAAGATRRGLKMPLSRRRWSVRFSHTKGVDLSEEANQAAVFVGHLGRIAEPTLASSPTDPDPGA